MSKELEALKRIETTFSMNKQDKESVYRGYTNSVYPYYEDFDLVLNALQRLESIDNSNPSEALEKLDDISYLVLNEVDDLKNKEVWKSYFDTIKQALLKAQEPKQYLKWEDLEFGVNKHKIKVQLNDSIYVVEWFVDGYRFKTVNFYAYVYKGNLQLMFYLQEDKKQFFNDLHLERVKK